MRGRALPPDKKRYLVHIYITQGYTVAAPLAIQYGVHPKAMSKFAKATGHKGKPGREPGVWKKAPTPRIRKAHRSPSQERAVRPPDPRWQWAIERGAVLA